MTELFKLLALCETAAGYALFEIPSSSESIIISNSEMNYNDDQQLNFTNIKLVSFERFCDKSTPIIESSGKLDKQLKNLLKSQLANYPEYKLVISDKNRRTIIETKLGIECIDDESIISSLMKEISNNLTQLLGQECSDLNLNQNNSNNPLLIEKSIIVDDLKNQSEKSDKIDQMIVNTISLLDEVDKDLNISVQRVREWYGWHFPELAKIVRNHSDYINTVLILQNRINIDNAPLNDVLSNESAQQVREFAMVSMGTDISDEDMTNICELAKQVKTLLAYRGELTEYLEGRMRKVAPNLTNLVGELDGARMIARAGGLINLVTNSAVENDDTNKK